jgi:penicillin-binding protein 1C
LKNNFSLFIIIRLIYRDILLFFKKKRRRITGKDTFIFTTTTVFVLLFIFSLPSKLFNDPYCTVICDRNGELLGAHIADDGQYRFPESREIPEKFIKAVTTYEDKRFYYHPGVDLFSTIRALFQNLQSGEVVSGGSTITMQVIRLSRKGKERTVGEKLAEMFLAIRLEYSHTKEQVMRLYASHAPFGGNVVGIDAASWRYFGIPSEELSWAQAATLAVLPNSPSLIHPGRNRDLLKKKRDQLLFRMMERSIIDRETYELSLEEAIPITTQSFPDYAPHLLMHAKRQNRHFSITNLDIELQKSVVQTLNKHYQIVKGKHIHNLAAIVMKVNTGEVLAYVGNSNEDIEKRHGGSVDIIMSERSTGSILKPFLYASALTDGTILPHTLIYDIPTRIGGYTPKNFGRAYNGAVPADEALARSLNIPAVRLLQLYGLEKFYRQLEKMGMHTLHEIPDHYGLSLILGGCEGTLFEIAGMYASMARTLNRYESYGYQYDKGDFHSPFLYRDEIKKEKKPNYENTSFVSASGIWYTFKAMLDVERPEDEVNWELFQSSEPIAWKTGTSFGFRDAWAIGVTPDFVVGVWAGNADGEGRPGIVGVKVAAPILFDIFDKLPDADQWFKMPEPDMIKANICKKSGYLASMNCDETEERYIPSSGIKTEPCPYHKIIHLDQTGQFRVNADCEDPQNMQTVSWFILPPAVESYYKAFNASYQSLPAFRADCSSSSDKAEVNMELIYPYIETKIYIPIDLDGKSSKTVFEAAHRDKAATIFWFIDQTPVGYTKSIHQIEVSPSPGEHILTLVDDQGEKIVRRFEIIR